MKLKVFSVRDSKVEMYLEPVYAKTKGEFLRNLAETLKNPQHQFAKFPADYTVFELGEYDQDNGILNPYDAPVVIGNVLDLQ